MFCLSSKFYQLILLWSYASFNFIFCMRKIKHNLTVPGVYKHYKGNFYLVVNVAKHTENLEPLVIYHILESPEMVWARPLSMFTGTVIDNENEVPRFKFILAGYEMFIEHQNMKFNSQE